jgi:hypothetical protein
MCRMLFIASDHPLPRIAWDGGSPAFNVTDVNDNDRTVAQQFSKPHLAYLGAHTGCSCGFCPETETDPLVAQSLLSLRSYLREVTGSFGTVELFECWDGEQDSPPGAKHQLTPDTLVPEILCYVDPPWFAQVQPSSPSSS